MGTTGTTLRCAVLCSPVQRWCDERRVDSGRGITGTHQTDSIAGFDGRDVGQTRPKISGSLFFFFFDCDGAGAERAVSQRNLRSPHTRRDPGQNTALYTCLVLRERPPEQRSAVRASYGRAPSRRGVIRAGEGGGGDGGGGPRFLTPVCLVSSIKHD
ncbi:hypothetical protein CH063_02918 [Colletotrichum higginsianum]|uniref:Uncharacterized protein n=1 Tax=Colletotrichum higginsianum (strain IMI 349063) TaxID=759273 RepID=H1VRA1_COLHI|nr:hypothetical protein CH063_02918 [Colletotrichum higginsianum]